MFRENVPVECSNFVLGGDNPTDLGTRTNTSLANLCGEKGFTGHHFYNYQRVNGLRKGNHNSKINNNRKLIIK